MFFLVLPWTKVGGHQTVLLDIPNRQFALFGLTFWAHDIPLLFFVLGILTIGLTLLTAALGRVWCGWACPQTVFIDRVYRRIEEWIEGNHVKRMNLAKAPMSWSKFWKKSLKWFLFWFVSTNNRPQFHGVLCRGRRTARHVVHVAVEELDAISIRADSDGCADV